MKKILVVLLILAVAGGVFAQQGEWSLSGNVEIGTKIDLDPDPDVQNNELDPATANAGTYNSWQGQRGQLGLVYSRDNATVNFGWNGDNWEGRGNAAVTFWGDNFSAAFGIDNLQNALSGNSIENIDKLVGEYKFFDGMISLRAAYKNKWEGGEWMSDGTAAWVEGAGDYYSGLGFGGGQAFTLNDNWYSGGTNYSYNDWGSQYFLSSNHLKAKVELGAINFGIYIPNLFKFGSEAKPRFIDDALLQSVFGLKFAQSPFEFAAQFQIANYGVYFGGKFFAGPITVGLSFMGVLDGDDDKGDDNYDPKHMKFGGNVGYEGDGFGGGVLAFYDRQDNGSANDWYETKIGIEPNFFYNAIPSHLRFALNVGFYFFNYTNGNDAEKGTTWGLQPEINWNFLGTGAGGWGASNTGITIRYSMSSADLRNYRSAESDGVYGKGVNNGVNTLEFLFKWGF